MQNGNSFSADAALLDEIQLSQRWQISTDKLRMDRWKKTGCAYIKIGRLVRYHVEDIVAYENLRRQLCLFTSNTEAAK